MQAVPVLLRRLVLWQMPGILVNVARPIRVKRDRFLNRPEEFQRMLQLAAAKAGPDGAVLVLLDADDDCPALAGPALAARVREVIPTVPSAAVLANREFEAWFIAAASSLHGVRGFVWDQRAVVNPDVPRNAKGWVRERTREGRYSPVADQAAFSQIMDLNAAHAGSRSFRKLTKACLDLCGHE